MIPYYANPSTTSNVIFKAVKVEKGRKYKGRGFIVAVTQSSGAYGWRHNRYGWELNSYETKNAKIWVPELGKFQYANMKYVEDDPSVSEADCQYQYLQYVQHTIQSTIAWCKSTKPQADEAEVSRFARNVLLKNHPEMKDHIDAALPDNRNLDDEISKTIKWATSLTTRPCYMYGRICRGGKRYSNEKYIAIARRALEKKGLAGKEDFEAMFTAACQAAGLL